MKSRGYRFIFSESVAPARALYSYFISMTFFREHVKVIGMRYLMIDSRTDLAERLERLLRWVTEILPTTDRAALWNPCYTEFKWILHETNSVKYSVLTGFFDPQQV